ncbi:hypothetical protein [uncultured Rhodoblastus sp.]|uniref:hypothetical protein n=1 Tax=uncultured Rhodoblastus sp. TaxID=543037 RepID=UPI0025D85CA2|nr:hypothetical protein [uncultured Rhodoblastus sp.]
MSRQSSLFPLSSAARIVVAGTFCIGAVFALAGLPGFRPEPEPEKPAASPRVEMRAAPAALPVYSYYPEQLAALQSLSRFQPIADAGRQPEPQPVAVALRVAAPDVRPARRPDSPAKPAPVAAASAAAAATATTPESQKIVSFPLAEAAEISGRFAGLRDAAASWGQAVVGTGAQAAATLGGKIASLWR